MNKVTELIRVYLHVLDRNLQNINEFTKSTSISPTYSEGKGKRYFFIILLWLVILWDFPRIFFSILFSGAALQMIIMFSISEWVSDCCLAPDEHFVLAISW